MKVVFAAFLSFLFVLSPSARAAMSEVEARTAIVAASERDFLHGRFDVLSQTAQSYAQSKARTSSGLWQLTMFYAGIRSAIDRRVAEKGSERGYAELDAAAAKWVAKYPRSAAAHITRSMILYAHAWDFRGGGYASTVSAFAWAPYRRHLELARRNLADHRDVASVDPEWYATMLRIANSEGWRRERFDQMLDEALNREPQYYETYFVALSYLLPKWHGNLDEIDLFVRAAVKRTAQTEGRGMYARIYWYASQAQWENDVFTASRARWPDMRDGFEDIVARYPDAWNLHHFAKFACVAGDAGTVRKLMPRIENTSVPEAWDPQLRARCMAFADRDAAMRTD